MAKRSIEESTLIAIADAIREKGGTTAGLDPEGEMPAAIRAIEGGAEVEEITNEAGGKSVYINSEVPEVPEGFTRLECIKSTGVQYINTGVIPNSRTRVLLDIQPDSEITSSSAVGVFGSRGDGASVHNAVQFTIMAVSGSQYRSDYNDDDDTFIEVPSFVSRTLIDKNKNVTTAGGAVATNPEATFQGVHPLFICKVNNNGTPTSAAFSGKVYSCRIFDDGTLVRNYVPCINESGEAGLYDLVNGVFYGDAAGGAFVAGPVVLEYELPEGYEELAWIKSTGSQYINTGYTPNSNTRVLLDAYNLSASSSWTFGAWTSSSSLQFAYSCGSYGFRYGSTNATMDTAPVGSLQIDFNKNAYNRNGTTGTMSEQTFTCEYPMLLFTINAKGAASSGKFTGQVSICQIYDNGTLVRYYVPCKSDTGEIGLWDAVNNTFTGDAAGVGFIAGPMKNVVLPEGYEELEWIQSSGSQYINTGFVPNQDTRVVCECDYSVTSSASWLFGVRVSSGQSAFAFLANKNQFRTDYKNSYTLNFAETTTLVKKVDKNKNVTTVNDGETITDTYADFDSVYPLYLFAINTAGSASGFASAKLKMMQIYDNGTLVRYYIPCKNASGEVGLWDAVNGVFYADAAGGAFLAGPEHTVAVSKVVLEDRVLIDLTGDTISPETVLAGFIGHDKTGAQFVGELVQKAGGRPFASGIYTSNSDVYTMTISGLAFKPQIVFMLFVGDKSYTGLTPIGNNSSYMYTFCYYYDSKTDTFTWVGKVNNGDVSVVRRNGTPYHSTSGKAPQVININADGFTAGQYYNNGYYFNKGSKYYWYAIGAES